MSDEREKADAPAAGEGDAVAPPAEGAGEDEASTEKEGDDRHLKDEQSPTSR